MLPHGIDSIGRFRFGRVGWLGLLSVVVACGGSTSSGDGGDAGSTGGAGGSGSGGSGAGGSGAGGSGAGGSGGSAGVGELPTSCVVPSDCVVVPASCCGACGAPARGDAVAVNAKQAPAYRQQLCSETACPGCDMPRDPTLVATCSAGNCELIDLLQHPSTACERNEDCVLRTNQCCNCGGAQDIEHLIAVNVMSSYPSLVCDPDEACDPCVDTPPDRAHAYCGADGHCIAEWALD